MNAKEYLESLDLSFVEIIDREYFPKDLLPQLMECYHAYKKLEK